MKFRKALSKAVLIAILIELAYLFSVLHTEQVVESLQKSGACQKNIPNYQYHE